jgi:hypothetical protein
MATTAELRAGASYLVHLGNGSRLWIVESPGGFTVLDYAPVKETLRILDHHMKAQPHLKSTPLAPLMRLSGPHFKYVPLERSPIKVQLETRQGEPLVEVFDGMTGQVENLRRTPHPAP